MFRQHLSIKKERDQQSSNTYKQSNYFNDKLGKASGSSREGKSVNNKTIISMDVSSKGQIVSGEAPFTISELIEELNNSNKKAQILEIITSWKYLDRDKELLETLFSRENFESIGMILSFTNTAASTIVPSGNGYCIWYEPGGMIFFNNVSK